MAIGDGNKTPWSDIEKVHMLAQVVNEKYELTLAAALSALPDHGPSRQDRLGCHYHASGPYSHGAKRMICKEKDKVKKAGVGAVGDEPASPTKKRTASAKAGSETPEKKTKRRAPRKNTKKGKVASEEAAGEDEDAEAAKAEPAEEDELEALASGQTSPRVAGS
ncbi:hypothetical protein LTR49_022381 [Elasticomyces elasticus]|nr:hypothetical protein LTR49_022381 [Elasticomyces elasticus]